jgi:hypothetical protein
VKAKNEGLIWFSMDVPNLEKWDSNHFSKNRKAGGSLS